MIATLNTWEPVGNSMVLFCPRRHLMKQVRKTEFDGLPADFAATWEQAECRGCHMPASVGAVIGCRGCEDNAARGFGPSHYASKNCESGGHPHCTCDTCF